ncbi:hypothetical protein BABINDRAFT_167107 [Babjeviella inositovora NRRL Y-12698]|uniref:Uncharacterized protein n=1 Tax=Babjeviella inositovora NRRL Y-12698 TaxID=984486 RepID=A0A1E3QQN3_9ASCO|nr:uncharacterized protein BABINDRAFT_167107 [Babjeviella inositovora NRRL Y-12698]ODQ80006.1 hypothetical protein BABINDRAFT_167107 [Babjeviella inositovora NRRL Y-12698]
MSNSHQFMHRFANQRVAQVDYEAENDENIHPTTLRSQTFYINRRSIVTVNRSAPQNVHVSEQEASFLEHLAISNLPSISQLDDASADSIRDRLDGVYMSHRRLQTSNRAATMFNSSGIPYTASVITPLSGFALFQLTGPDPSRHQEEREFTLGPYSSETVAPTRIYSSSYKRARSHNVNARYPLF